jgi:hypothetical protein
MALEGSLKEFGLADILQLLYYQRKTGVLSVESGFDRVRLLFYEGNIVFADSVKRGESRLGRILLKKGLIAQAQLEGALEEQKKTGAKLGNTLIKMGAISKEDLHDTLTSQITELVSYLFTWRQGRYEFRPQGIPIDKDVPVSLDTQHVLMEGLRILDEWSAVEGKITLESVFTRTGPQPPDLTEEEAEVLARVDGENDVSEIAALSGLDNFQVSKALLGLYEKGVIGKKKAAEEARPGPREKFHIPALLLEAAVVGLFAASLIFWFAGGVPAKSKPFRASEELDNLRFLVELYRVENGRYPEKIETVGKSADPWGRPYVYSSDGKGFTLLSPGPDGSPGTPDDIL